MTETRDGSQNGGKDDAPPGAESLVSQRHYDPDENGDLTMAIVGAVAEAKSVEITALTEPLLYDTIDAEALEISLFGTSTGAEPTDPGRVQFEYHGFTITVDSDGWIRVYESSSD